MSDESTYRLLVQQTNNPGMPLKHVGDGRLPPWSLPLVAPSPKKTKNGGGSGKGKGSKSKKKKDKDGGGGGGGDNDDSSPRMGIWEELFDAVNGTKIWYVMVSRLERPREYYSPTVVAGPSLSPCSSLLFRL